MPAQSAVVAARDLRAHPLRPDLARLRRGRGDAERRAAGPVSPASSPTACARPRPSCRPGARTAASPTSTSAPRAPRSAGPSAARRTPAAAARSGSDAWKAYMRRQTQTVNFSTRPAAGPGREVRRLESGLQRLRQIALPDHLDSSSPSHPAIRRSSAASRAGVSAVASGSRQAACTSSTPGLAVRLQVDPRRDRLVLEEGQDVVAVGPLVRPGCRSPAAPGRRTAARCGRGPRSDCRTATAGRRPSTLRGVRAPGAR